MHGDHWLLLPKPDPTVKPGQNVAGVSMGTSSFFS